MSVESANGAVWTRWAIGLATLGVIGNLGFNLRMSERITRAEQRLDDDQQMRKQESQFLKEGIQREFSLLHDRISDINDKIVLSIPTAPPPSSSRRTPAFNRGRVFDK